MGKINVERIVRLLSLIEKELDLESIEDKEVEIQTVEAPKCGYGDAVEAITANMSDGHWSAKAINYLQVDRDADYYRAVIAITKAKQDDFWKYSRINGL